MEPKRARTDQSAIRISNVEIADVKNTTWWSESDPFVKFKVGDIEVKVKEQLKGCQVSNGHAHPPADFQVVTIESDFPLELYATLWDHNRLVFDEYLACALIKIGNKQGNVTKAEFKDTHNRIAGLISFKYEQVFEPGSDANQHDIGDSSLFHFSSAHHLEHLAHKLHGTCTHLQSQAPKETTSIFGSLTDMCGRFVNNQASHLEITSINLLKETMMAMATNLKEPHLRDVLRGLTMWDMLVFVASANDLRHFKPQGFYHDRKDFLQLPRYKASNKVGHIANTMGPTLPAGAPYPARLGVINEPSSTMTDLKIENALNVPDGKKYDLDRTKCGDAIFMNPSVDMAFGQDKPTPILWGLLDKFPITDIITFLEKDDDMETLKQGLQLHIRNLNDSVAIRGICPPPCVHIENPTSDEAMTRVVFYGYGQHRIDKVDAAEKEKSNFPTATFKLDLTEMAVLEPREYAPGKKFETYGGVAYFNKDFAIVGIVDADGVRFEANEGNDDWEHAKLRIRSSLLVVVTVVDHLAQIHFGVASAMLSALNDCEELSPTHMLRVALHPFTYRSSMVGQLAQVALIPEKSAVMHMGGFTPKSYHNLFGKTYTKGEEWLPLSKFWEKKDLGLDDTKMPYKQDGIEMFNIYRKYFGECLENIKGDEPEIIIFWQLLRKFTGSANDGTTNDNRAEPLYTLPINVTKDIILDHLAQFAYLVTVAHEYVGIYTEYMYDRNAAGFRTIAGHNNIDDQGHLIGMVLVGNTQLNTPMLRNDWDTAWYGVFNQLHKHPEFTDDQLTLLKKAWGSFQNDLTEQAVEVKCRNTNSASRKYPLTAGDPDYLNCGLSF
eukprot:m.146944 g.146944  ORF g.146944 m.146944 type:complete len:834 (+) comp30510_c0_seq1:108-2609(+)